MSVGFSSNWKSNLLAVVAVSLMLTGTALAAPSITLSKKTGPPTSQVLVSGEGFEPNVGVDIYFDTKDEVLVVTNSKGEFTDAKAYAPRKAWPGKHWVTALERNNDKGAQKPFEVFTNWPQFGFDPSLSGFNPYENVLDKNNASNLGLAWTYTIPTSYDQFSSPAVWEGAVYVVFGGGMLYALDAETGAVLWSYAGPAVSPAVRDGVVFSQSYTQAYAFDARTGSLLWGYTMDQGIFASPPAVDNGEVLLGEGGHLYALNAASGALLWMFDAGESLPYAPAVANGVVYVCGPNPYGPSYCYGLDEKTGSLLWQAESDYGATGVPTVAYGLVFVEEEYSGVLALDAATGTIVWQYSAGVLQGSPTVANGKVYVTGDGGLLALDAYTGALLWHSMRGGVSSSAIANGVVYSFYWYGGGIDAIDAGTGSLLWTYPIGDSSIYSPVVANGWVFSPACCGFHKELVTQVYAFRLKHGDVAEESSSANPPSFSALRPDPKLKALNAGTSR